MSELRWNPLLGTYTMVASNRQARPQMPKEWCPFCPGSGKVPNHYEVLAYPNDFPTLSKNPPAPDPGLPQSQIYTYRESYGVCEVILYSPDHYASLSNLSLPHIEKIVELWTERFALHAADPGIKYIFEFENKGEAVGVTMPHPHGQLYGYSFVPLKIEVELHQCKQHYLMHGSDLLGDMNLEEISFGKRLISINNSFTAYLPFFTDYPYGVFIVCNSLKGNFTEFSREEKKDLAAMLKDITAAFDKLFDEPFPYMMCIHQTPVNCPQYADSGSYYRFHIEFYPPLRDANKIKYYASSEMGAWAAANTRTVEETARELVAALDRYKHPSPL